MSRKKIETAEAKSVPAFEQALERLETIVAEMESGELSLEDMMARFEEGQALVKVCSTKLNQVERRIEVLMKEGDKVVAAPLEAGDTGEDDSDGAEEEEAKETPGGLPF